MTTVCGVRFKRVGKVYYFDPGELKLDEGECVIVETSRGLEFGEVTASNRQVADNKIAAPLRGVVRRATEEDIVQTGENKAKETEARTVCEQKIVDHKLDMKLVDVEYTFDRSKVLFYFTSDGRVDFRELVKDLASVFRMRIELRQIGIRDESKMLGGLGICGKPFCCSTFLDEFRPVSIKMAKEQGLSLNPTKISGTCGRLMCCLKYEQEAYEELIAAMPKVGAAVKTPAGMGVVTDISLLRGIVKVSIEGEDAPIAFPVAELTFDKKQS